MKRLLLAACIASLAACGGGKDDVKSGYEQIIREQGQSLVYAFPGHQQIEVPTPAPVALRFTSAIKDPQSAAASITITDAQGQSVAFSFEAVDGDQGLLLTPDDGLAPLTQYTVKVPALALVDGNAKARTLAFTTRGLHEGPASQVSAANFEVKRLFPDGTNLPVADMSSLRLQLSQPIDRSTVKYGNAADSTINLTDANGALVPASVLVGDGYLTIDPTDDMTPGQTYTLTISPDLKSRSGNSLAANSGMGSNLWRWSFQPIDTRPTPGAERARMVQLIDDKAMDSPLTGKQINQVPMYSVLLGLEGTQGAATPQAHGYLAAELAHLPSHPDVTPLTIKRGSLIETDSMTVHIGGEVPAGFDSGTVRMEFLSDATGYLIDNPFSSEPSSPKQLRLMMDMGISADVDKASGAVTQTIQHIELVGTAIVEDGMLTINAMGVVEPNVLGTERASALLSFYMQGLDDQNNAPTPPVDDRPLELVSWTMEDLSAEGGPNKALMAKPGDPIILNFNKPLDAASIIGQVHLLKKDSSGVEVDQSATIYADGAALIIKPDARLSLNEEDEPVDYTVVVGAAVADIHGNALASEIPLSFALATSVSLLDLDLKQPGGPSFARPAYGLLRAIKHAPVVLATYPGYPCALMQEMLDDEGQGGIDTTRDLANNIAGFCAGAFTGNDQGTVKDKKQADDKIVIGEHPKNRPIIISFSDLIDPSSVVAGTTFVVEEVDNQNNALNAIEGKVSVQGSRITFTPENYWSEGKMYRYTVKSSGYIICEESLPQGPLRKIVASIDGVDADQCTSSNGGVVADHSNYQCGVDAICSTSGLPIQTNSLGYISTYPIKNDASPTGNETDYIRLTTGPSQDAGGPDFVQYFRGSSTNSSTALQVLDSHPIADQNHNFFSEVSNTGNSTLPFISVGEFAFPVEEQRPLTTADDRFPNYDPNGVMPSPNSAKVLSRMRNDDLEARFDSNGAFFGFNVGCSYWDENTAFECPEHKFTSLRSSIIAEVTSEISGNGIVVNIHPSILVGTSLDLYTLAVLQPGNPKMGFPGISGTQVMRMRHPQGSAGPIKGFITTENGKATLKAEIGLYIDLPYATEFGIGVTGNGSNARSYEAGNMIMEGNIEFLDDGRMLITQTNLNNIDLLIEFHNPSSGVLGGYGDFFIPPYGTVLQYLSDPIKD